MAVKDWVSASEAGQIIKAARDRIPLTQEQVAEELAVDKSYISKLEGGQHHAGRSKYFPMLVDVLRLTDAEVQRLNPAAVITLAAPDTEPSRPRSAAFPAAAQYGDFEEEEEPIEDALAEAARRYGGMPGFSGIGDVVTQRALQGIDFRQRPQTPEEWLEKFLKYRDDLRSSDA